jgi:hypothetical protein
MGGSVSAKDGLRRRAPPVGFGRDGMLARSTAARYPTLGTAVTPTPPDRLRWTGPAAGLALTAQPSSVIQETSPGA